MFRTAQSDWLQSLKAAEELAQDDDKLQKKAAAGLTLKERNLPPEVLGRLFTQYCQLFNRFYDHYLTNLQLQKLSYIQDIVRIFACRLCELRKELVHILISDFIFVDAALKQVHLTPDDIQLIIPYHFPNGLRSESTEAIIQEMWAECERRKNPPLHVSDDTEEGPVSPIQHYTDPAKDEEFEPPTEDYLQARLIQQRERFRTFQILHNRRKLARERLLREVQTPSPPELKQRAASYIQRAYRAYMQLKREQHNSLKRDILLGMVEPSYRARLNLDEQNAIKYKACLDKKRELREKYWAEFETEKSRIVVWKRDNIIDDITVHIREWLRYWYTDYGFFPQYPFEPDGGTILVIRGDFIEVEEKIADDEKQAAQTKGKTKEQMKEEKQRAKEEARMKMEAERERKRKEAEVLVKMKCDPRSDPGYTPQVAQCRVSAMLRDYAASWKLLDQFPPDSGFAEGHLSWLLTEDIMAQMHKDCRIYADELMRLELNLLTAAQQRDYKNWGLKYPKIPRPRAPRVKSPPRVPVLDDIAQNKIQVLFDAGVVQNAPAVKIKDIIGDSNYYPYDCFIKDPDATFPPPSYGNVRERLRMCALGACPSSGVTRRKSLLLLGLPGHGKTFMANAICGELNATKIDLSPEVFNRSFGAKTLALVCLAAKLLQPTVIFLRNIERVFAKKIPKEEKHLKPAKLKTALGKTLMKNLSAEDNVIFIATCSDPFVATALPMVKLFEEIILVPRLDYISTSLYLQTRFTKYHSMPRDYSVQPLAQVLQGYGTGLLDKLFQEIMTPERVIRLHHDPLLASEFLEPIIDSGLEPYTEEDFKAYIDWHLKYTSLGKLRAEYDMINTKRADIYRKLEAEAEKKKQ